MSALLGCIADDFTGATDLASTLVAGGMRTVVLPGVPEAALVPPDADALVIALKSRSIPAGEAVAQSLASLDWLRAVGCRQFYFKYCSTFDSTDAGNIGPVTEALLARLDASFTIACPAFPANGRTVYRGYLFVGDVLLSESSLRNHPLNPMTDPSLVRVLGRQMLAPVGLIGQASVAQGVAAVREAIAQAQAAGVRVAIADALSEADLITLGAACSELPLVTGGSGMAMGLPANFRARGLLGALDSAALPPVTGLRAVIAGSCSAATRAQVARMRSWAPAFEIDPCSALDVGSMVDAALDWALPRLAAGPLLVYSSADVQQVSDAQQRLGPQAGTLIEQALAGIAHGLVEHGVRQLVVAGGETSGAVVSGLGVRALRIGAEICPGVPWTAGVGTATAVGAPLLLALKSGNFGGPEFFREAFAQVKARNGH